MATEAKKNGSAVASLTSDNHEQLRSKTLLQRALWRLSHDYLTLTTLGVVALMAILSYAAPIIVQFMDIVYNNNDLYNSKLPLMSRVVDSNSTILQWEPEAATYRRAFIAHTQVVDDLAVSSDGQLFATVSPDRSLRIWHIATGRNRGKMEFSRDSQRFYTSVAFSRDGLIVATGDNTGELSLWDPMELDATNEVLPLLEIPAHEGAVNAVTYLPDGTVLSGGADGLLKVWNPDSGDLVQTLDAGGAVGGISLSPDGTRYAVYTEAGDITIYDAVSGEAQHTWSAGDTLNRILFAADNAQVITAGDSGKVTFWTLEGTAERSFDHPAAVNDVRYTPDGSGLVTGSDDAAARVWDLETGEIRLSFADPEYPYAVTNALYTPDNSQLITTTAGRERLYILGTDTSGRDHLSRLLYAGQISLRIGFLAAIGSLTIGVAIGVVSGFFGGRIDDLIVWVITTLDSIPSLYLLLIVSALLAPNDTSLIFILVVLGWTGAARIVRGETFSLREREYVVAARALGASNLRIMFYHIVPNVVSVLVIVLSRAVGNLILAESSLSFLNFGVKPPTPTWGNMLTGDLTVLREAPHLVYAPGLMITITVLCLFVIGDGMRDAFDPNIAD